MSRTASRAPRALRIAGLVVFTALALAGCASSAGAAGNAASDDSATGSAPTVSGELTVFAAASLQTGFDEIAAGFEAAHPEVDVAPIVYDGSSTLATQLQEGASADVFASADEANMSKVTDLIADPKLFATNTLVIATPPGNPGGIETLEDLADPDKLVVLCAEEVPCGAASQRLLAGAGLDVAADSYEQNVTAVITKVAAGEADAGLVYRTDAAVRDDVESTEPDGAADVVNRYPISALDDAPNPDAAAAFVAYVTGAAGQEVLAGLGFGAP